MEEQGILIHQAREVTGIHEKVKERFDYVLIEKGLHGISDILQDIGKIISTFDMSTRVLQFSQDEEKEGKKIPIYDERKENPESLLEFIERVKSQSQN